MRVRVVRFTDVTAERMRELEARVREAGGAPPGVNSTGSSSSVSDDLSIDIRGLGASETQALLDGHPVGPQGVYPINGGGSYPDAFNYADSPIFGLSRVQVTFGSVLDFGTRTLRVPPGAQLVVTGSGGSRRPRSTA